MTYQVKLRKLFNLYTDWLLKWGYQTPGDSLKLTTLYYFRKMTYVSFMIVRVICPKWSRLSFAYFAE